MVELLLLVALLLDSAVQPPEQPIWKLESRSGRDLWVLLLSTWRQGQLSSCTVAVILSVIIMLALSSTCDASQLSPDRAVLGLF